MASSGSVRYLHSAVWLDDLMLVFGGNTHNDTSISLGAKCYSPDFMAYDPGILDFISHVYLILPTLLLISVSANRLLNHF